MNGKHRLILENVFDALSEVGERLNAIDHQNGEEGMHWQTISALGHSIRRQARQLPDDLFSHLPALAIFTLTVDSIDSCWGQCMDELDSYLRSNQQVQD